MVTAELMHNPYLQKTSAKFNGQSPKVNCELEKYESLPLADWVNQVPKLFYNEMNGYDFDLNFIGTKHDFEILKEAFQRAGVVEEDVRFFLKNEMETPDVKNKGIDVILNWLKSHRNRRFDFDAFMDENQSIFAYSGSYIMVRMDAEVDLDYHVNVETVNNISELDTTLLSHTPILFYLTEETMSKFRDELVSLLKRDDIKENQLFFLLDLGLNEEKVLRVIHDLGVSNPQKVMSVTDEKILKYLRNYPIAEYVREAINVLEKYIQEVQNKFDMDNSYYQAKNREVHEKIEKMDDYLRKLQECKLFFSDCDNYRSSYNFDSLKEELIESINGWKKRVTKIKGDYECDAAITSFNNEFITFMRNFFVCTDSAAKYEIEEIKDSLSDVYCKCELDVEFKPNVLEFISPEYLATPNITDKLFPLKQTVMEQPSNGLFGFFKKSNEPQEPVPVVVGYTEEWRKTVVDVAKPLADQYLKMCLDKLKEYRELLYKGYLEKVILLMDEIIANKEDAVSKLSDEDKIMQVDSDWLSAIRVQLDTLERS